ncbi:MAG TPA: Hsp20/alpha crystallin family protein [Thermoanaerobaculia bacterium]|jgi:HSP20 family protein
MNNLMTRFDRVDPFDELTTLRNRFDRILNRFTGENVEEPMMTAKWAPAADVLETKDAYVVKAELPGVEEKNINVEIENGVLTLKGDKMFEKETEEKGYRRIERAYGNFLRTFTLPQNVYTDKITATFFNGVLEVTVPKKEEAKPRKITLDIKKKLAAA